MSKIRLGDIAEITKLAGFEFTKYIKYNDYGEIIALRALNLRNGNLELSDIKRIDKAVSESLIRSKLFVNDILLTYTGNGYGDCAIIEENDKYHLAPNICKITPNPDLVDPYYLYTVIRDPSFRILMSNYVTGSGQPTIPMKTIRLLEVECPDITAQRKISGLIKSLDYKIKVNTQVNQNLVQQLELIYNEMYPYDTDAIPDGWRSVHLGDVCESISVKHDFKKDELIFLNTGDIENGCFLHSNYSAVESMPGQAKKTIKKDDILYSEIRPINRHYAYVSLNAEDYVVSTKLMVIRAKGIDSRRLYHYLTSKSVIDELQHEAETRSGTFPQIRFDNIQRLKMIIAPPEQEKAFCEILHAYYRKIDANIAENERLSLLRDSILPKLMSGELDVS